MPRKMITFSDLSDQIAPEGSEAIVTVIQHPAITAPVQLDVAASEIANIIKSASDYVMITITQADEITHLAIGEAEFNALFSNDPYVVLANARPVKTNGNSTKRNPQDLQAMRVWCRTNGWPEIKDKGRVPLDVQAAYEAARSQQAAAA